MCGARGCGRVRGAGWARAADAPRWWAATAARRARRAPGRRGMSSAPARPGPRARHGAGRARAPTHPLLRQEDLPQAHLLPPLLRPAVGAHRPGLRLRRYASRMRPERVDTARALSAQHDQRYATHPGVSDPSRPWSRGAAVLHLLFPHRRVLSPVVILPAGPCRLPSSVPDLHPLRSSSRRNPPTVAGPISYCFHFVQV